MLFTSEQVSDGHPDKICDQISDAILDACLEQDQNSRVAIESLIKDYDIVVAGELTTNADINIQKTIWNVLKNIGLENIYDYKITIHISKQSNDIAMGVNKGGAGDQGIMFGYATNETPEMLPIPYVLATKILKKLKEYRQIDNRIKADAKSQVTYDYENNRIDTILVSTQHSEDISLDEIRYIISNLIKPIVLEYNLNLDYKLLVNPTGRFVVGSSFGDTGVTGRKIIADTYGGICRHGGGAFSGKDPSKVDRSAAYMCRKIAKDIINNGFANKCEIQIGYAIGIAEPISLYVNCFGTNKIDTMNDIMINKYIKTTYDLTPNGIIKNLDLLKPIYGLTSTYGHFTNQNLPWEV